MVPQGKKPANFKKKKQARVDCEKKEFFLVLHLVHDHPSFAFFTLRLLFFAPEEFSSLLRMGRMGRMDF